MDYAIFFKIIKSKFSKFDFTLFPSGLFPSGLVIIDLSFLTTDHCIPTTVNKSLRDLLTNCFNPPRPRPNSNSILNVINEDFAVTYVAF